MNKENEPFDEDEFMDFGKVDPPWGEEIFALGKLCDKTDMTREVYDMRLEKIHEKYINSGKSGIRGQSNSEEE